MAQNWNQNQYGNQYNNNNNWQQQQQRPPQQQQYNNNYNQQRPPQQQYNNNNNYNQRPPQQQQYNNNNNYNQRPPQQQYNNNNNNNQNYNNNTNNWQPQQQQQPQYNNTNTTTTSQPEPKPKKRNRSGSKPLPYKVSKILDRFGGIFGILAIICGVSAILCMIISMSVDEITFREASDSVSVKCGFSKTTYCGQFASSLLGTVIDVDCDSDWTGCCSFKMKDMCDETDFYCREDTCLYCDNMKAGNVFLLTSIISFIIICIATITIFFRCGRERFVSLGLFILAIIAIIVGLIAYPAMLGNAETDNLVNENGCGDSPLCCYFTDCDDDDENCPTPIGQTYTGEIVAIIICVLAVIFIIISNRCSK